MRVMYALIHSTTRLQHLSTEKPELTAAKGRKDCNQSRRSRCRRRKASTKGESLRFAEGGVRWLGRDNERQRDADLYD
jgi:hypothetical protein